MVRRRGHGIGEYKFGAKVYKPRPPQRGAAFIRIRITILARRVRESTARNPSHKFIACTLRPGYQEKDAHRRQRGRGDHLSAENTPGAPVSPSQVVVVIAHPDDEIFASGTLCLLAEKGLRITIVAMTDGEGGDRDTLPPQATASLAAIRRHELALSAAALGVAEVLFLSYPDVPPPAGPTPQDWDEAHIVAALERILLERKPELILTHGPKGGYGHPAHKLTHRHVMAAATRADFGGCIFSFCGLVKGSPFAQWCDDPSDVLIDARDFLRSRAASLASHQTQLGFFLQPYFPRTLRDYRSSMIGYALWFTSFGRKRIPIATPTRLFQRHPKEGLVLWKTAKTIGATYFLERFSDDRRVEIVRQRIGAAGTAEDPGLRRTGAA